MTGGTGRMSEEVHGSRVGPGPAGSSSGYHGLGPMSTWPISMADVLAARGRLQGRVTRTPLRQYGLLDRAAGGGLQVLVKHENHQPTQSFKARNGLAAVTALKPEARSRGVLAASRGNHGQGLAWAGSLTGTPVVVCVPHRNSPDKNAAMRALGAEVVEEGADYDEALAVADRLAAERGLTVVHSTNNRDVIAGAGTLFLEMLEEAPGMEALVVAVGGGSQAVGALTVVRALKPGLPVFGVQAAGAPAIHDSWHAREALERPHADTFADGLATRKTYAMTFPALLEGLAGFVTVTEEELAEATRLLLRTTHNLAEGAGAAGLAGLLKLRDRLPGRCVGMVLTGSNLDAPTLQRILEGGTPHPGR